MDEAPTNDAESRKATKDTRASAISSLSPAAKGGDRRAAARPRAKVKTGCRTCKRRKVKCDEGRPACARCVSTGRACEGYGIWGGGNIGAARNAVPATTATPAAVVMGMTFRQRSARECPAWPTVPRQMANGTLGPLSAQEYGWLDWFRWRTAVKIRGAFSLAFWDVLVIRASFEEPAVLHAALALSTVHRRLGGGEGISEDTGDRRAVAQSCREEFTLRQYNKAIRHLMASSSTRGTLNAASTTTTTTTTSMISTADIASTRTMLVTCMLFTCLEFMRGRFQTGHTHLQNGVRLLGGLFGTSHSGLPLSDAAALYSFSVVRDRRFPRDNMDVIDQWLLEAFARMNLMTSQFGHGYAGSLLPTAPQYFFSPDHRLLSLPITFATASQARAVLDQLTYDVFSLTGQARHRQRDQMTPSVWPAGHDESAASSSSSSPSPPSSTSPSTSCHANTSLAREQARLVTGLDAWFATYRASRISLYVRPDVDLLERVAYQMLVLYYDMASILVRTCLAPDAELAFDAHTDRFLTLLRNALLFIRAVKDVHNSQHVSFQISPELAKQLGSAAAPTVCLFNADVGWTPPLYFTALHCRVGRIRKQAIRFVKSIPSREGLWDSQLASAVAEAVIHLETGEESVQPYHRQLDEELFRTNRPDPVLAALPASQPRIHNVHVVLPDGWSGTTTMTCEKHWSDGSCEEIRTVFDPKTQLWSRI
ncbi:hypothetical protein SCUCBS95973_005697 [Sporothrix curviconia]|uniref:Zn(2)-C6 fungal-type domain-containing protein n=1 Tax=Sporothrix curviconia TaxID=1260050 RepID=A0ABP0BZ14_9PEZI